MLQLLVLSAKLDLYCKPSCSIRDELARWRGNGNVSRDIAPYRGSFKLSLHSRTPCGPGDSNLKDGNEINR